MSSGGGRRNDEGHQGGAALVQGRAAVPIDRVVRYLKTGKDTKHGSGGVPIYLSAVLEYSPPSVTPWLRALHQSAIASKLVQQSNVENMGEYCRHHDEGQ
ncbi:unnamed protein product [Urochloa humidicola]